MKRLMTVAAIGLGLAVLTASSADARWGGRGGGWGVGARAGGFGGYRGLRAITEDTATVAPDIGAVGGATVEPRSGLGL